MRRRDLAIGFGVLLVLVINMAMLIVTSHRAQRLAQLQMDFVTAVSHELRTPLTVIISGADNICNGVVETGQQMAQYGSVIGNQARQLFGLVERILLFAATRQGRLRYNLRPLQVHEVIDAALASTAGIDRGGSLHRGVRHRGRVAAGSWGRFRPFPMPPESDHQRLEVWR